MRGLLSAPPTARYPIGGWSAIVERMRTRALALGVEIECGHRVEELPEPPVIVATELARRPRGCSATTASTGSAATPSASTSRVSHRRGDPFVVVDLQETRLDRALHGRRRDARARRARS